MSDAMRWHGDKSGALILCDWVHAEGGQARYVPQGDLWALDRSARILIRTRTRWVDCAPGQTVVMGEWFDAERRTPDGGWQRVREFTVEDR